MLLGEREVSVRTVATEVDSEADQRPLTRCERPSHIHDSERDVCGEVTLGVPCAHGWSDLGDGFHGLVVQSASHAWDDRVRAAQRRVDVVGP